MTRYLDLVEKSAPAVARSEDDGLLPPFPCAIHELALQESRLFFFVFSFDCRLRRNFPTVETWCEASNRANSDRALFKL